MTPHIGDTPQAAPHATLSDQQGIDLAYALLMDAIDSRGNLTTLKGKAQTLFAQFGITLDENDLVSIEPELKKMIELADKRGLWGKMELSIDKGRQTTGAVLEDVGKTMQTRQRPGLADVVAKAYVIFFKGPADVLADVARALIGTVDEIAKKLNFSIFGRNVHLRSSKRDIIVGKMVRMLNTPHGLETSRGTDRRITLAGRALTHAARISKSEDRRERGRAR